jgi:hypothetical protein
MCCFSRPVQSVNNTRIFARSAGRGRQFLVYSMDYRAKEDLAMILPIPVAPDSGEKAVRFINLDGYPEFFAELKKGFPDPPPSRSWSKNAPTLAAPASARLAVQEVGSFVASFVPTARDFARLDRRFALPPGAWDDLPQVKGYGFAVFQLKPGNRKVHPMAFEFPRANPRALFFPTVHIHDGKVHQTATFDHTLYCQKGPEDGFSALNWRESAGHPEQFMNPGKTHGIVQPGTHCYMLPMSGRRKNQDIILA